MAKANSKKRTVKTVKTGPAPRRKRTFSEKVMLVMSILIVVSMVLGLVGSFFY